MERTSRADGHPIDAVTAHPTIHAVTATMPCQACFQFWVHTPRARLRERLRRDEPAALDHALVHDHGAEACVARQALLEVVFGEASPELPAHPKVASALVHATLDQGLVRAIQQAR